MSRWITCPSCGGKGHVMDGAAASFAVLTVFLIPAIFLDRNNKDGLTRTPCGQCDGKGFVRTPDSDD